jgi:hypothetical protein
MEMPARRSEPNSPAIAFFASVKTSGVPPTTNMAQRGNNQTVRGAANRNRRIKCRNIPAMAMPAIRVSQSHPLRNVVTFLAP